MSPGIEDCGTSLGGPDTAYVRIVAEAALRIGTSETRSWLGGTVTVQCPPTQCVCPTTQMVKVKKGRRIATWVRRQLAHMRDVGIYTSPIVSVVV